MTQEQQLQQLSQMLYPQGRAFRMPEQSELYQFHRALNVVFSQTKTDADQILNDILPDNNAFDIDDAHDWYRRLWLYDSGSVLLADMKAAIRQKQSFPLTPLDKQHYQYIEDQLHAAGFTTVFVYENRFDDGAGNWITKSPSELLSQPVANAELGAFNLGEANLGSTLAEYGISIIANYLEEDKDAGFDFGDNLRSTFYIGSALLVSGALVDIPAARKLEFRQLLMKLKPAQTAGFLFVNYV
jgi:hypothetical protein